MNLTTKGRYAVMAMVDIAMEKGDEAPVKLAEVAERQEIALNYLEQIFVKLKKAALVRSVRGPGGGYMLALTADNILISDIIQAVDEPIKMTRCDSNKKNNGKGCMHDKSFCATHALWDGLGKQIYHYLSSVSLKDVCEKKIAVNYFPDASETLIAEVMHG